jgi:gas vesicle protein
MNQEPGRSSAVVPFLLGGLVGALLGLLFAPKPGSEMRRQIRNLASSATDRVSSTIGKGMDIYDDARIAVTSAVAAGKEAYLQEREKFQAPL